MTFKLLLTKNGNAKYILLFALTALAVCDPYYTRQNKLVKFWTSTIKKIFLVNLHNLLPLLDIILFFPQNQTFVYPLFFGFYFLNNMEIPFLSYNFTKFLL